MGRRRAPRSCAATPERTRLFALNDVQLKGIQDALTNVVGRGTAAGSRLQGIAVAGKTGTAQNAQDRTRTMRGSSATRRRTTRRSSSP